jgi:hypothetical protein
MEHWTLYVDVEPVSMLNYLTFFFFFSYDFVEIL